MVMYVCVCWIFYYAYFKLNKINRKAWNCNLPSPNPAKVSNWNLPSLNTMFLKKNIPFMFQSQPDGRYAAYQSKWSKHLYEIYKKLNYFWSHSVSDMKLYIKQFLLSKCTFFLLSISNITFLHRTVKIDNIFNLWVNY